MASLPMVSLVMMSKVGNTNKGIVVKEILEKAVRWNAPVDKDTALIYASDCKDHTAVRHTSYMEVHEMLKTSGCSKEYPWWNWSVMGVIDMEHGKLSVSPGDWVVEIAEGHYIVLKDETYKTLCTQQTHGQEYNRPDL